MEIGITGASKQTADEVEETFRTLVVARSLQICTVQKYFVNPLKGPVKFMAAAISVEKTQSIDTDDRIKARSFVIKVGLE
jgi:hypothetical protein